MRLASWGPFPLSSLAGVTPRAGQPLPAKAEAGTPGLIASRALAGTQPEPGWWTCDLGDLVFLSRLALSVLALYRRAAVRAGARVGVAAELHTAVCAALTRANWPGPCETAGGAKACVGRAPLGEDGRAMYPSVNDVQRTFGVTWRQLVEQEPQLEALLRRAQLARAGCRGCGDVERGFGPLRNDLAALIGFAGKHRGHPVLGSAGAYEVAYWKLHNAVAGLAPGRGAGAEEAPESKAG
jgi:hypothetical protein